MHIVTSNKGGWTGRIIALKNPADFLLTAFVAMFRFDQIDLLLRNVLLIEEEKETIAAGSREEIRKGRADEAEAPVTALIEILSSCLLYTSDAADD